MAKIIKLFRNVRKLFRLLGIYPPAKHHQQPLNMKNCLNLTFLMLVFVSSFAYFLFKADSVDEYGQTFFVSISCLQFLLYFIVIFSKMKKILKFIKNFEKFIQHRE